MPNIDREKMRSLCKIMNKVHALAGYAWPRDGCGVSAMPEDALRLIMDIQGQAKNQSTKIRALGHAVC